MPSLLSPTSANHPTRSYTPLTDEFSPVTQNPSPVTRTRNGTIVYSKRTAEDIGASIHSNSEETLSPSASAKGKQRALSDDDLGDGDGDGDMGELRRSDGGMVRMDKGKGKERAWDAERGVVEVVDQRDEVYPPLNDVEQEEKRIQEVCLSLVLP